MFSESSPHESSANCYEIECDRGRIRCGAVVIATGGLSILKIGATDFGNWIARQFGLLLVEPRPALVSLTFDGDAWDPYAGLAGLSLPVQIETGSTKEKISFLEDLFPLHPAGPVQPLP